MPNIKALALMDWDKKFLPWQPEFFMEFKSLIYSESTSPKDHFYKVSLKSVGQFHRKKFFK